MTDVCQGVLVTPVLNCEPGALAHFQRTLSDIDMDLTKDPDPMQIDRQRSNVAKAHDVPRKSYVPDPSDYPDAEDSPLRITGKAQRALWQLKLSFPTALTIFYTI